MTGPGDSLDDLLRDAGREDHLVNRMIEERTKRGWTQGELARQLKAIGYEGLKQPAISAIEKKRGRRAVTVDEALALARVFQLPLASLLLPDGALDRTRLHGWVIEGPRLRRTVRDASRDYNAVIRALARDTADSEYWDNFLSAELEHVEGELQRLMSTKARPTAAKGFHELQDQKDFLTDLMNARAGDE